MGGYSDAAEHCPMNVLYLHATTPKAEVSYHGSTMSQEVGRGDEWRSNGRLLSSPYFSLLLPLQACDAK